MNIDWNAFNQNMQNMAASVQQMTSIPHHFNHDPNRNPHPMSPMPLNIPYNPAQNMQQNAVHQAHRQQHHQLHHPYAAPAAAQPPPPPPPQVQQSFIVPSIPIAIGQQPIQQIQQPPLMLNDLNDFAQRITAYSQQMVQSLNSAINQQHNNNSIVFPPQTHQNTVQQIVIHNNNGQQQIHQIQHISAAPLFIINNQSFAIHPQPNTDVIDLTNGDDEEQDIEEYKEEFVPWKDEDIPSEYKCPISLEIMCDPVILSDGFYYERECIEDWLRNHQRSPMTNLQLHNPTLTTDLALRQKINKWKQRQWDRYHAQHNIEEEHSQSVSQYSDDDESGDNMEVFMEHDHENDVRMKM